MINLRVINLLIINLLMINLMIDLMINLIKKSNDDSEN